MQVCNLTTPAQYFHVLRRQMKRAFRKPLVIMTPKSLLRARSSPASEARGVHERRFHEILPGPLTSATPEDGSSALFFCSGKVYYDLLKFRDAEQDRDGWPHSRRAALSARREPIAGSHRPFPEMRRLVWCQEESQNMGAWTFIEPRLRALLVERLLYAGRNASASPAVGALALHKREQSQLSKNCSRSERQQTVRALRVLVLHSRWCSRSN